MMNKSIDGVIRRRNSQGIHHETVSVSIPKKLAQVINGVVVRDSKSRSRVITELLENGLKHSGITINEKER